MTTKHMRGNPFVAAVNSTPCYSVIGCTARRPPKTEGILYTSARLFSLRLLHRDALNFYLSSVSYMQELLKAEINQHDCMYTLRFVESAVADTKS